MVNVMISPLQLAAMLTDAPVGECVTGSIKYIKIQQTAPLFCVHFRPLHFRF